MKEPERPLPNAIQKKIQRMYGEDGLRIYDLIDGKRSLNQIKEESNIEERKLLNILFLMQEDATIDIHRKPLSNWRRRLNRSVKWQEGNIKGTLESLFGKNAGQACLLIDGKRTISEIEEETDYSSVIEALDFLRDSELIELKSKRDALDYQNDGSCISDYDSENTIPTYIKKNPASGADIVVIDGCAFEDKSGILKKLIEKQKSRM